MIWSIKLSSIISPIFCERDQLLLSWLVFVFFIAQWALTRSIQAECLEIGWSFMSPWSTSPIVYERYQILVSSLVFIACTNLKWGTVKHFNFFHDFTYLIFWTKYLLWYQPSEFFLGIHSAYTYSDFIQNRA